MIVAHRETGAELRQRVAVSGEQRIGMRHQRGALPVIRPLTDDAAPTPGVRLGWVHIIIIHTSFGHYNRMKNKSLVFVWLF